MANDDDVSKGFFVPLIGGIVCGGIAAILMRAHANDPLGLSIGIFLGTTPVYALFARMAAQRIGNAERVRGARWLGAALAAANVFVLVAGLGSFGAHLSVGGLELWCDVLQIANFHHPIVEVLCAVIGTTAGGLTLLGAGNS